MLIETIIESAVGKTFEIIIEELRNALNNITWIDDEYNGELIQNIKDLFNKYEYVFDKIIISKIDENDIKYN